MPSRRHRQTEIVFADHPPEAVARPRISDWVSTSDQARLSPVEVERLGRFRWQAAFQEWARSTYRKAIRPEDLDVYRMGVVGNLWPLPAHPEIELIH